MKLRFVIPMMAGVSASNFEDVQGFQIIDVMENQIVNSEYVDAPPLTAEKLPEWLEEKVDAHVLITGRIDPGILDDLNRSSINVITGAPSHDPENLVFSFLNNSLKRITRY